MREPDYWCDDCESWVSAHHAWMAGYRPHEGDEEKFAEWDRGAESKANEPDEPTP